MPIHGRPPIWEQRIPEIVQLYSEEKLSRGAIARKLGTSVQTITRMLTKAGVLLEDRPQPSNREPLSVEHRRKISEARKGKGMGIRSPGKQPRLCGNPICSLGMFQPKTAEQVFCSRSCRNVVRAKEEKDEARAAWDEHPDLCPCGKAISFEQRHTRRYCSEECRKKFTPKKQVDPTKSITFNCQNCGKEVTRNRKYGNGANKYCSNPCAQKHTKIKRHIVVEDAVVLDSGWEALVWGLFTFLKIPIERYDRAKGIEWAPGHYYAPDFLLPTLAIAIEVKGLEDDEDDSKWDAWKRVRGERLQVLSHDNLDHCRQLSREDLLKYLV